MSFVESDDEISAAWSGGDDVDGDFSQSRQHEIIDAHHQCPHMSIDELLKVVKVTNGMPVMFVLSSDGRLAAVPVEVLQNQAATNVPVAEKKQMCSKKKHMSAEKENIPDGKKHKNFRSWLLLLTTLVATITFTAGLSPPGGFWDADNNANGYVAGTSVMRDKFPARYLVFYYSNTTAFFSSLVVIGMLANSKYSDKPTVVMKGHVFVTLVAFCFVSLGTSYITGTWDGSKGSKEGIYTIAVFALVLLYMSMHWIKHAINKIKKQDINLPSFLCKKRKAPPACLPVP